MKVAILGKNGQVGQACVERLSSQYELLALGRDDQGGDLWNLSQVEEALRVFVPDVIINATAFTAVDEAEKNVLSAYHLNVVAPTFLASLAREMGAFFLHFSTDYVFDGIQKHPYVESDRTHAINVYGESKLEGEKRVLKENPQSVILRLTWVHACNHRNFISSLVRWMKEKSVLSVVDDQWGIPTSASEVARGVERVLQAFKQGKSFDRGVYHFACSGYCSRYECALYVKSLLEKHAIISEDIVITAVKSDYFPLPAQRPSRAVLEHTKFDETFEFAPQSWQCGVKKTIFPEE